MSTELAFGAVGAVAGVLGVVVPLVLARRNEGRKVQAAARVLLGELKEAREAVAYALDENCWDILLPDGPSLRSWEQSSQALAARMRGAEWECVLEGVRAVQRVADFAKHHEPGQTVFPATQPGAPEEVDRDELTEDREAIDHAIIELARRSRWKSPLKELEFERDVGL